MATTVDGLCQQAQTAIKQREWEKARQLFQQAMALKSDVPEVHNGLATVCFQMRDLPSAVHHFKEVTRIDPLRAGAFINLGAVYNLLGQYDEAITALRRGIQLDGHMAEGYYNLGLVYKRKGQLELGISAYREALRINPRMGDAHYNLANLYLEKQQFQQALDHYKVAFQLRPGWDRAEEGIRQAREALEEAKAQAAEQEQLATPPPPVVAAPSISSSVDPNRMIDPDKHAATLTAMHRTTIESEGHSLSCLNLIQQEIEPALKELSMSLLNASGGHGDLEACVKRFEAVLGKFRAAQLTLHSTVKKLRPLTDQVVKH